MPTPSNEEQEPNIEVKNNPPKLFEGWKHTGGDQYEIQGGENHLVRVVVERDESGRPTVIEDRITTGTDETLKQASRITVIYDGEGVDRYKEVQEIVDSAEPKEVGNKYQREHPKLDTYITLRFSVQVRATLESLGQTTTGGSKGKDPWGHFEIEDPDGIKRILRAAGVDLEKMTKGSDGKYFVSEKGDFGGGVDVKVGGEDINVTKFGRLDFVGDELGEVDKIVVGKLGWEYKE